MDTENSDLLTLLRCTHRLILEEKKVEEKV
jgi:hypothetical protein